MGSIGQCKLSQNKCASITGPHNASLKYMAKGPLQDYIHTTLGMTMLYQASRSSLGASCVGRHSLIRAIYIKHSRNIHRVLLIVGIVLLKPASISRVAVNKNIVCDNTLLVTSSDAGGTPS
eukprot:9470579-Pyramimonas_sp.AAC.1